MLLCWGTVERGNAAMKPLKTALLVGALLAAANAAGADPLSDLLAQGGGEACYDRVYDAAHLTRIPGQDTRTARLSLVGDEGFGEATIRIVLEGRQRTSIIVGECNWRERANLDTLDRPLLDTFKGRSGLDCHAHASISLMSAEEGGDFVVDLRDGRSVMLHLPDSIAAWPTFQRRDEAGWAEFGVDDRVFRLDRAASRLCRGMNEGLHILP